MILAPKQLSYLINHILDSIKKSKKKQTTYSYFQSIGSIASTVGYKLGPHLNSIIPRFFKSCDVSREGENPDAEIDHLIIEVVLNSFEQFIRKCPKEVTLFLKDMLNTVALLIEYDPNYSYDENEAMEIEDLEGDWGEDWGEEEQEPNDDDSS